MINFDFHSETEYFGNPLVESAFCTVLQHYEDPREDRAVDAACQIALGQLDRMGLLDPKIIHTPPSDRYYNQELAKPLIFLLDATYCYLQQDARVSGSVDVILDLLHKCREFSPHADDPQEHAEWVQAGTITIAEGFDRAIAALNRLSGEPFDNPVVAPLLRVSLQCADFENKYVKELELGWPMGYRLIQVSDLHDYVIFEYPMG